MQAGDRVMVYDSPGHPLDHYLYATVLTPSDKGALVLIDHPANPSHNQQKWAPADKIMSSADALKLAEAAKQSAAKETDGVKRQQFREHFQHFQFVASELT